MTLSFDPLLDVIRKCHWVAQRKVAIEMLEVSLEDPETVPIIERVGEAHNEALLSTLQLLCIRDIN